MAETETRARTRTGHGHGKGSPSGRIDVVRYDVLLWKSGIEQKKEKAGSETGRRDCCCFGETLCSRSRHDLDLLFLSSFFFFSFIIPLPPSLPLCLSRPSMGISTNFSCIEKCMTTCHPLERQSKACVCRKTTHRPLHKLIYFTEDSSALDPVQEVHYLCKGL